jgi:uncharacterized protein YecE (DUF72 family)
LHGPGFGKYQETYSIDRLRRWSKQVEDWAKDLAGIYIYCDNDQAGYAARNALALKQLVTGKTVAYLPQTPSSLCNINCS